MLQRAARQCNMLFPGQPPDAPSSAKQASGKEGRRVTRSSEDAALRRLAALAAIDLGQRMRDEGFTPTGDQVERIARSFLPQLRLEVDTMIRAAGR